MGEQGDIEHWIPSEHLTPKTPNGRQKYTRTSQSAINSLSSHSSIVFPSRGLILSTITVAHSSLDSPTLVLWVLPAWLRGGGFLLLLRTLLSLQCSVNGSHKTPLHHSGLLLVGSGRAPYWYRLYLDKILVALSLVLTDCPNLTHVQDLGHHIHPSPP